MPNLTEYAEAGRQAVVAASIVCREIQNNLDAVRTITKDDKSPVTVADYAAQAVVAMVLKEHIGEFVMVAEESSSFLRDEDNAAILSAVVAAVQEVWDDATPDDVLDAIDLGAGDTSHHKYWTLDPVRRDQGFPPQPAVRDRARVHRGRHPHHRGHGLSEPGRRYVDAL